MARSKILITEDKIESKVKLIEALKIRIVKEQKELIDLQQMKKKLELNSVSELLFQNGLKVNDLEEIIKKAIESKNPTI